MQALTSSLSVPLWSSAVLNSTVFRAQSFCNACHADQKAPHSSVSIVSQLTPIGSLVSSIFYPHCFECAGPSNQNGLQLKSFRINKGLEAHIQLPKTYQAFPGIMNGGAVGGLFDCHGNWTAAIALMDHSSLPKPPLTLTTEVLVRPTVPPQAILHIESSHMNGAACVNAYAQLYLASILTFT